MSTTVARGSFASEELPRVAWHVSSRSVNGSGNCVEAGPVVDGSGRVAVRHSHHPSGPALVFDGDEWTAFLAGLKRDTFDAQV